MNYIRKLQEANKQLQSDMDYVTDWMINLEAYLLSSKFHQDTTVQTRDILLRLDELAQGLIDPSKR
jgi:hypothetical protein